MKNLYAYQNKIEVAFKEGKNIVLQAPTGAGKTIAVQNPWLRLQTDPRHQYPPRLIFVTPMRILTEAQLYAWRKLARERRPELLKGNYQATIQTGDSPMDQLFEGRIIFCTIDQLLASFLNIPYGIPNKLSNINAGAFIGSYIIFDEFHLYPSQEMMLTVLAMLKMLKGLTRFSLMSATFSHSYLQTIAELLEAEVIADATAELFNDIDSIRTQRRTYYAAEGRLDTSAFYQYYRDETKILLVLNQVSRAQQLYAGLKNDERFDVQLIHSRFYQGDRQKIQDHILERFDYPSEKPIILIATQVVEVGLDLSAHLLMTECAPASSVIQRAGRCARRRNEEGRVIVFQPIDAEGAVNYAPYIDDGLEDICVNTWAEIMKRHGEVIDYRGEQEIINATHAQADAQLMRNLQQQVDNRIGEITRCMSNPDRGCITTLIRKVDNVSLWIHSDPNNSDQLTKQPYKLESLSVSRGILGRLFETMQDIEDIPFILQTACLVDESESESRYPQYVYRWEPLKDKKEVWAHSNYYFVVHPNAIGYSSDKGLYLLEQMNDMPTQPSPISTKQSSHAMSEYHSERYHEHITGLSMAYRLPKTVNQHERIPLRDEIVYPLKQIGKQLGLSYEELEYLLRLVMATHDLGKLNIPFQKWSKGYQIYRSQQDKPIGNVPLEDTAPLAHTQHHPQYDRELQRNFKHPKRGTHAVESAAAIYPVLKYVTQGNENLLGVALASIMHHHTYKVDNSANVTLKMVEGQVVEDSIQRSLNTFGFLEEAQVWIGMIERDVKQVKQRIYMTAQSIQPSYGEYGYFLLYLLFVRTLRLADQRSGNYWNDYHSQPTTLYWND